MHKPTGATVELDFLGVGSTTATANQHGCGDTLPKLSLFQKFLERGRSLRGVHQAGDMNISSLVTSEVLKSVISGRKCMSPPPENAHEKPHAKPMTVFYGGSVAVFHVTPDKFESIARLAMEEKFKCASHNEPIDEDLPIARKKSLQRFLEKRKESGSLEILDKDSGCQFYDGFVAHLNGKVCRKAVEHTRLIPNVLPCMMLSCCNVWEETFQNESPTIEDIALFFFPGNFDRSKEQYFRLLEVMETQDLVLRIEDQVFPMGSLLSMLPVNSKHIARRFNRLYRMQMRVS